MALVGLVRFLFVGFAVRKLRKGDFVTWTHQDDDVPDGHVGQAAGQQLLLLVVTTRFFCNYRSCFSSSCLNLYPGSLVVKLQHVFFGGCFSDSFC